MDEPHHIIKSIREDLGYSQLRMSELMGIDRSTYINFERGVTKLVSRNLAKFLEVTNHRVEQIFCSARGAGGPLTAGYLGESGIADRLDALTEEIAELKDMIAGLVSDRK